MRIIHESSYKLCTPLRDDPVILQFSQTLSVNDLDISDNERPSYQITKRKNTDVRPPACCDGWGAGGIRQSDLKGQLI